MAQVREQSKSWVLIIPVDPAAKSENSQHNYQHNPKPLHEGKLFGVEKIHTYYHTTSRAGSQVSL
jgi:hypothetical protein